MKSARQTIQRSPAGALTAESSSGLAIHLHDLHKHYGHTKTVDGVDLRVTPGEIVGPNGAGKSTTIDMVLGLEEGDAFADRIILMARGHIVADGSATEIKGVVGARTIRATLVDGGVRVLEVLDGVTPVERHGDTVNLQGQDSDTVFPLVLFYLVAGSQRDMVNFAAKVFAGYLMAVVSIVGLLGGAWGPIFDNSGVLNHVVQLIPSYRLVQAGHSAIATNASPAKAWIVVAVWAVVLTRLAMTAYRRDTDLV
jgi:hypothetical protein